MTDARLSTGIPGLDEILAGGLIEHNNVLVRGPPGAGKTIFGLHFLANGIENDETVLYINLGEPSAYVKETADFFDLHAEEIHFHDLAPSSDSFDDTETYTLFSSAEVEQPSFISELRSTVDDLQPDRVLLDPITEFRYLTTDDHQFRTQILGLLDFLKTTEATVMLTSQASEMIPDDDLQFLTDAVINLHLFEDGRSVSVSKFRGSSFRHGTHSYKINDEGVVVWPSLTPELGDIELEEGVLSGGVPELDQMLGGGLAVGTVTFISGPTGSGKTTTGLQFLAEAAGRGKQTALYSFEESQKTIFNRSEAISIPIVDLVEQGTIELHEVLPDQYSIDEFTALVSSAVEDDGAEVIMLDGIQGFKQNLRGLDSDPAKSLLRLGRYLRSNGITTIITNEIHNITGEFKATEEHTSNLADNIVFLRHVEYQGEIRKVIGVLKMRTSDFERTLRELEITEYGLKVGEPLPNVRGILTGTPEWEETKPQTTKEDGG